MNVYMTMAALILLLALLMRGDLPKNKKYIILSCLIMFAVYGLRDTYTIGVDASTSYLGSFTRSADTTIKEIWDTAKFRDNVGWLLFERVCNVVLGGNYQQFITLISVIVMVIFGRFVYRYSASPVQSFIYYWGLWFFAFNFSALKQSLAMSFILLAFDGIIDRKLWKFLFFMIIASSFHYPALVFLPTYWVPKLNVRRGFLVFLFLLLVAVYFWRDQIVDYVSEFYYEDRTFEGEDRFLTGKVSVMLALILTAYIIRPPSADNTVYSTTLQLVAIASVIQLFSVYNNVFERLADYYFQFSVVFVPYVFRPTEDEIRGKKEKQLIVTIAPYILGILCLMRFNDYVNRASERMLPYQFYFQVKSAAQDLFSGLFL